MAGESTNPPNGPGSNPGGVPINDQGAAKPNPAPPPPSSLPPLPKGENPLLDMAENTKKASDALGEFAKVQNDLNESLEKQKDLLSDARTQNVQVPPTPVVPVDTNTEEMANAISNNIEAIKKETEARESSLISYDLSLADVAKKANQMESSQVADIERLLDVFITTESEKIRQLKPEAKPEEIDSEIVEAIQQGHAKSFILQRMREETEKEKIKIEKETLDEIRMGKEIDDVIAQEMLEQQKGDGESEVSKKLAEIATKEQEQTDTLAAMTDADLLEAQERMRAESQARESEAEGRSKTVGGKGVNLNPLKTEIHQTGGETNKKLEKIYKALKPGMGLFTIFALLAIAGIVIYAVIRNFGALKEKFSELFSTFGEIGSQLVENVKAIWSGDGSIMGKIGATLMESFKALGLMAWETVKAGFTFLMDSLWKFVWDHFGDFITKLGVSATAFIFKWLFPMIYNAISGSIGNIPFLKPFFVIIDTVVGAIKGFIDGGLKGMLIGALAGFIGSFIPGVGGFLYSVLYPMIDAVFGNSLGNMAEAIELIIGVFTGLWQNLMDAWDKIKAIWSGEGSLFSKIWNTILTLLEFGYKNLKLVIGNLFTASRKWALGALEFLSTLPLMLVTWILEKLGWIEEGTMEAFRDTWKWLSSGEFLGDLLHLGKWLYEYITEQIKSAYEKTKEAIDDWTDEKMGLRFGGPKTVFTPDEETKKLLRPGVVYSDQVARATASTSFATTQTQLAVDATKSVVEQVKAKIPTAEDIRANIPTVNIPTGTEIKDMAIKAKDATMSAAKAVGQVAINAPTTTVMGGAGGESPVLMTPIARNNEPTMRTLAFSESPAM